MAPEMGDLGQLSKQYEQTGEGREGKKEEERGSLVPISEDPPEIKIVPWEDFQNALANLCGAASVTSQLRTQRDALAEKLESALKVN